METYAKVIADSVSPLGCRLTTIEVQFPRFVLPQVLTHRMWSRSCESLRARPTKSKITEVGDSPVVPVFAVNRKGMTAGDTLSDELQQKVREVWLGAMEFCVGAAEELHQLGVAKQWANRLLEPFAYQKAVVTATDWGNFFRLRTADDAQPEIQELANKMKAALDGSKPKPVQVTAWSRGWHLPYFSEDLGNWVPSVMGDPLRISAGRCARVSYTTHDGRRDPREDLRLSADLVEKGHSNPFEHQATPAPDRAYYGNFFGWVSQRHQMEQSGQLPDPSG
jgi:hypothetical protein